MKATSTHLDSLLRKRIAERSREQEQLTAAELQKLGERLRRCANDALRSIATDTEQAAAELRNRNRALLTEMEQMLAELRNRNRSLRRALLLRWLPPCLLGAALVLAAQHGPILLEIASQHQSRQLQNWRALSRAGLKVQTLPDQDGRERLWLTLPAGKKPVEAQGRWYIGLE